MRGTVVILVEQVQIGAGAIADEQWLELPAGYVPLQMLVVFQVLRRVIGDVGVDVFDACWRLMPKL